MFEFIKNKVNGMVDKKISPKKKMPVKKDEAIVIGAASPMDSNICIGKENKTFLTIEPNGKMIFNKNDFPEWKVDNFAREFVNIVEEITNK
jgi:hypothetical protein